jgi:hypothetical protein
MMRARRRGQSLVVTALIMLILVLAVFFTFTVGERVRQKTTAQAAADAAAYSNAVIEARAFNFYAFSNRAMVSHAVAMTSVMAHQSYLSFYEDSLITTALMYEQVAARLRASCGGSGVCASCGRANVCQAATRATEVASLYAFSMPERAGRVLDSNPYLGSATPGFVWVERGGAPVKVPISGRPAVPPPGRIGWQCEADKDCSFDLRGPRGALWFHDQYHAKRDGNWCGILNDAVRDELTKIQLLRAHQLDVNDEVLALLGDTAVGQIDVADMRAHLPQSGQGGRSPDGDEGPSPELADLSTDYQLRSSIPTSLADQLVARFDAKLDVVPASQTRTRQAYAKAVFDQHRGNFAHKDYDQVLYSTRYPNWVVQRTNGVLNDANWQKLEKLANVLAGPDRVETIIRNAGNAGAVGEPVIQAGPDRDENSPWEGNTAYLLPLPSANAGVKLAELLHDDTAIPSLVSLGAEDHGDVTARYTLGGCGCPVPAGYALEPGRSALFNAGGAGITTSATDLGGFHSWHGHAARVGSHAIGSGRELPLIDYAAIGHMRFKPDLSDELLAMPRIITEVRREKRTDPRPWDFDVSGAFAIGGRVQSEGRADTGRVAAAAGALVYFHPPDDGPGPGAKEPPNFWSPFWRAKLHPLRADDLSAVDPDVRTIRSQVPLREMAP